VKKMAAGITLLLVFSPIFVLAKNQHSPKPSSTKTISSSKAKHRKGKVPPPQVHGEFAGDIQTKDVEMDLEISDKKIKGSKGKTK